MHDAASWGIAGVDFDVVHYGLASTPAMFNSTLTKNEDILCPVDGAIMITGKTFGTEYYTILKEHCYAKYGFYLPASLPNPNTPPSLQSLHLSSLPFLSFR
ncbi:putative alpha-D-phosphohexomutase, alpha/beta/alpha I/II/III [Helianthus annuus]|nr:putative alpha-D-phosphohexomutase, alpha/beta/alpha I/II/III [Helianthus annuus]